VLSEGAYLGKRVVTALYDWAASSYDRVKNVSPADDASDLARPLLQSLQAERSPLILDVASGTGRLPLALLRQWSFPGQVVGLDLSRRMLEIAQRKTHASRSRIAWIRQDAMALPFPDHCFHAVCCIEALEFLPEPLNAVAEMARVLRPGGELLLGNRIGSDRRFFPGRSYHPTTLQAKLKAMGMFNVRPRRWQVHYSLIQAQKAARSDTVTHGLD
jgi:ubiquinone/menaquinone biosynthesis C-methylase UbiE